MMNNDEDIEALDVQSKADVVKDNEMDNVKDNEMEVEEVNLVKSDAEAVNWLIEMTGCKRRHAREALAQANGDISDAIDVLPTIQNPIQATTDDEIRKLIQSADVHTSDSRDAGGRMSSDITPALATQPDVIVIDDDTEDNAQSNGASPALTGSYVLPVVTRLVEKTGASVERVQAALRLAGDEEEAAFDVITRHSRKKRTRSGELVTEKANSVPAVQENSERKEIVLLCWNIDGLCERGLSERFSAVIAEIKNTTPHVVLLQEVVDDHVARIRSQLGLSYDITFGDRSTAYYNVILISKTRGGMKIVEKKVRKFPCSIMGRHLVHVVFELYGRVFSFYTSHIESMKEHSKERTSQINKVLEQMGSNDIEHITIFGGDTNLRDAEMSRVSLLKNFYDVWERLGRNSATKHTWDTTVNTNLQMKFKCKLRFDRIIARESPFCTATSFTLVGKTLLPSCDMFPSDHWGILANFQIT